MVDNVEENRFQLFFPGKPEPEIIKKLKSYGFKWSRYAGCWQRHRSNSGKYWGEALVKEIKQEA